MIRLSPSRISLTETDIHVHLQRILANQALLSAGFEQAYLDSYHGYMGIDTDELGGFYAHWPQSSPSSARSSSTCTLEHSEDYAPITEKGPAHSQLDGPFSDGTTESIDQEIINFEPEPAFPDMYGYGTDVSSDGRISARRRTQKIWPSKRPRMPRSSSTGRRANGIFLPSNMHLETPVAWDAMDPSHMLSGNDISVVSRSSSLSWRAQPRDGPRNPRLGAASNFGLATSISQLGIEDGATSAAQHAPLYRHSAVRKSSLLRFAQTAISEQTLDTDTDTATIGEGGIDETQEVESSAHHRREPASYHLPNKSYPFHTHDADASERSHGNTPNLSQHSITPSCTEPLTFQRDSHLSCSSPGVSLPEERGSPLDSYKEVSLEPTPTCPNHSPRQDTFVMDSFPCSSFLRKGPPYPEMFAGPTPTVPYYYPLSYERTRLPSDPDAELPTPSTTLGSEETLGMNETTGVGGAAITPPTNHTSNNPLALNTGSFPDYESSSQSTDRTQSVELSGEEGQPRQPPLSESPETHLPKSDNSGISNGATDNETPNDRKATSQNISHGEREEVGQIVSSSAIVPNPAAAAIQGSRGSSSNVGRSLLSAGLGESHTAREYSATPARSRRLPPSPTSVDYTPRNPSQREVQVYDDSLPAAVQPQTPADVSRRRPGRHPPHTAPARRHEPIRQTSPRNPIPSTGMGTGRMGRVTTTNMQGDVGEVTETFTSRTSSHYFGRMQQNAAFMQGWVQEQATRVDSPAEDMVTYGVEELRRVPMQEWE